MVEQYTTLDAVPEFCVAKGFAVQAVGTTPITYFMVGDESGILQNTATGGLAYIYPAFYGEEPIQIDGQPLNFCTTVHCIKNGDADEQYLVYANTQNMLTYAALFAKLC